MISDFFEQGFATAVPHTGVVFPGNVDRESQSTHKLLRPLDPRIQVVVMRLENNSHQQIGIDEMARLVNLSPSRLAHLFKSETKFSIQQYLTQLRIAKAKAQLESSFRSIKEIAASVGFSSVTRFAACFKSLVGATPAQYRKDFSVGSFQCAERGVVARSANS